MSENPTPTLCFALAAILCVAGCSSTPNILLISIDTLRADHLGAYGYTRQTSPFMDQLAREGAVFSNAIVPMPATDPSHASLFTSMHPLQHNVLMNNTPLKGDVETLAEVLQKNGYTTIGAVAVEHLSSAYNFNQGFDYFSDQWNENEFGNSKEMRTAASVHAGVTAMLEDFVTGGADRPFFLFVHYFDVHQPYVKREAYALQDDIPARANAALKKGSPLYDLIDRYDSEIRYVDDHISHLFDLLEKYQLNDNLLVCITSDHGEQLGDHGYDDGGHVDIYTETIRVPLVFWGDDFAPSMVSDRVSSMDIAVSVLARVGLGFENEVEGIDLFAERQDFNQEGRDLLVMGYPSFTRSLGLLHNPYYYIQNLDSFYENLYIENKSGIEESWSAAPLIREDSDGLTYLIPLAHSNGQLSPFIVTTQIHLDDACESQVSINLEPRLKYTKAPIPFSRALRLHFPVISELDRTSIVIMETSCATDVKYVLRTYGDFVETIKRADFIEAMQSDLYREFRVPRKNALRDELFNLRFDPSMNRNLEEEVNSLGFARLLFNKLGELGAGIGSGEEAVGRQYELEEIERLKSLGYIQ